MASTKILQEKQNVVEINKAKAICNIFLVAFINKGTS